MSAVVTLLVFGALLLLAAIAFKFGHTRQAGQSPVCFKLRMAPNLSADSLESFLVGITGLLPPWWRRWLGLPSVTVELVSKRDGMEFRLLVADQWASAIERLLISALPAVRYVRVACTGSTASLAREYRLSNLQRPLRLDPAGISSKLLSSLQPLAAGESVIVQWTLAPAPPSKPIAIANGGWGSRQWSCSTQVQTSEAASALREKQAHPLLLGVARIGVRAGNSGRSVNLLRQVEVAWHGSRAPGVYLKRLWLPNAIALRRLRRRTTPVGAWPGLYNARELVGLIGFPVEQQHVQGLELAGSRFLPASERLPRVGTVIGDAEHTGVARPIALSEDARLRHLVMIGPTGAGKSTAMLHMIEQDMANGSAVLVIEAKGGDLVSDVLDRVPTHRRDDVAVLDVADSERPVGVNPLRLAGVSPTLAAEQLVSVLHRIYSASWGVRSEDLWRASLRLIAHDPSGTVIDVGPLLTDAEFRAQLTRDLKDPVDVAFWCWFASLSSAERAQMCAPVLNKWRALAGRPSLRRVLGQPAPEFDLAHSLNHHGIVLVPLSAGLLGEDAAALFGAVVINVVWNLIQARASTPSGSRQPLMVFLDEFARYTALPVPLEELLAQARSYRVGITIGLQHLHQMAPDLRHSVLANPRSRLAWQVGRADAEILAREFGMGLAASDLQNLPAYEVVAQLYADGRTQPACTVVTRPPSAPIVGGAALLTSSRLRWGRDGEAIDSEMLERHRTSAPTTERSAPGRKPRAAE